MFRAFVMVGKFFDYDELRDAMKENGIGRPSTRAAIIETLFRRHYIKKEKKSLSATPTGVELIDLIHEELLKSPELTGIWEKKLRDIEHKTYDAGTFINELKMQITEIVRQVLADSSNRRITIVNPEEEKAKAKTKTKTKTASGTATSTPKPAKTAQNKLVKVGDACPSCGKGTIIQGRTALGCSRWNEGCGFRQPLPDKP